MWIQGGRKENQWRQAYVALRFGLTYCTQDGTLDCFSSQMVLFRVSVNRYDAAIVGMRQKLLKDVQVNGQNVAYIGSSNSGRGKVDNKMEHLTCFVPGMLALGAVLSEDSTGTVAASDMQLAKRLAFTCHQMYVLPPHLDHKQPPSLGSVWFFVMRTQVRSDPDWACAGALGFPIGQALCGKRDVHFAPRGSRINVCSPLPNWASHVRLVE